MPDLNNLTPIEILALTIYGEARGEITEGQIAVGCVIRNRVNNAGNNVTTYNDICLKPEQFSCWNKNDPNYVILLELADKMIMGQSQMIMDKFIWIAKGIVRGYIKDTTNGAQYYLTNKLYNSLNRPSWASLAKNVTVVDNQTFFNV